jgi:hypothetical protein
MFGKGIVNKTSPDFLFLFATPTFISGAARVLDLYAVYDAYNCSSTEYEADFKAISSDWMAVGQDIGIAMKQFERSLPPESIRLNDEFCGAGQQMSFFP